MSEPNQDFPHTDQDVRVDRDVTRQELGETVEALAHKFDVRSRVKEGVDEKLDQAQTKIADMVSQPAADRLRQGADAVRANPLPVFVGVVAFFLGVKVALRLRDRRTGGNR